MILALSRRYDKLRPNIASKAVQKGTGPVTPEFVQYLKKVTVQEYAKRWIEEMDKNRIDSRLARE